MNRFRKLMACATLCAICLTTIIPARASESTFTATKVPAVALGIPYEFTVSVQNNSLVISGNAPSYLDDGNFVVDLIEPVDYTNQSIDADGLATLDKSTPDLWCSETQKSLHPTVVGSITHPLSMTGNVAPYMTVTDATGKSVLTYDIANVPKIPLSGLSDGIYNLRTKFSSNWADCPYLYCDEILIVVQSGKASLQVLPNYIRNTYFGDGCMCYEGYSLTNVE